MLVSPVLTAMVRVLQASENFGHQEQIASVVRELRMAEADMRAALEDLEYAPDEASRLMALRRCNRTTRWVGALTTSLADLMDATLPI